MVTTLTTELDEYVRTTPISRELSERARRVLPGGTTRTSTYFPPYPLYFVSGEGCRVTDADGRTRIDLLGNYSCLILGHSHPVVTAALAEQIGHGVSFAAPTPPEVELAELLCERVPSLEQVRFASSGTEATMFAMRLARAFTGRIKIARFEGGYHGSHDAASVSGNVTEAAGWGEPEAPKAVFDSVGIDPRVLDSTIVLPFNDLEASRRILAQEDDLAAIIVEPMLGKSGMIPAAREFLQGLRDIADERGALLIFDEIMTLRVAFGGAQSVYGVTPDLTTMGKIIGGGLPVAAFGGRREIMQLMSPSAEHPMPQGGTFNGSLIGVVAGLAQMRVLDEPTISALNERSRSLREGFERAFARHGVRAHVTGMGSLFNVHFATAAPSTYRPAIQSNAEVLTEFVLGLLNEGVVLAPRGMVAVSTAIGDAEEREILDALERVLLRNARSWTEKLG